MRLRFWKHKQLTATQARRQAALINLSSAIRLVKAGYPGEALTDAREGIESLRQYTRTIHLREEIEVLKDMDNTENIVARKKDELAELESLPARPRIGR